MIKLNFNKLIRNHWFVFALSAGILLNPLQSEANSLEDKVIKILKESSSQKERMRAAIILARSSKSEESFEALIEAMNDQHYSVRAAAARALAFRKNIESIGSLLKALEDPESIVVSQARRSLASVSRLPGAAKVLVEELPKSTPQQRFGIIQLLNRSKSPEALSGMLLGMTDPDPRIKSIAIEALKGLSKAQLENLLLSNIDNSNLEIQKEVIKKVAKLQLKEAIFPMLKIYQQTMDMDTKTIFKESLRNLLDNTDFEPLALEFRQNKNAERAALSLVGMTLVDSKKSTDYVLEALESKNSSIWKKAVLLSKEYKIHAALPLLRKMVEENKRLRWKKLIQSAIKTLEK